MALLQRYATYCASIAVLAAGLLFALDQVFVTSRLDLAGLLAFFGYPVVFLGALALGAATWRTRRWRAFLPALVLLIGLGVVDAAARLGRVWRDDWLRRQLPQLEAVIATHVGPAGPSGAEINPAELPSAARASCLHLTARRDSAGRISATCVVSRELAYVYDPGGATRSSDARPFAQDWYEVSR